MTISAILAEKQILVQQSSDSKNQVVDALVNSVGHWNVDIRNRVQRSVLEREEVMSTGVGNGIAIPHAKVPGLEESVVCLGLLSSPVDFGAYDGQPVDVVFLVVGPDNRNSAHLKILSRLSRMLANAAFLSQLRQAGDASEAHSLIRLEEERHAW